MASIKGLKRMCNSYEECEGCPMSDERGDCKVQYAPRDIPDDVNEIVDKWVAEYPVKTYAMDFFEKFPNAPRDTDGTPLTCWQNTYGYGVECSREIPCAKCWNREMEGNNDA